MDKERVLFDHDPAIVQLPAIREIARGAYWDKTEDQIQGSGYVVKSLEAALWCFHTTGSFKDAVLKAVNFGEDADTTAAICGQLSGASYGISSIPSNCLKQMVMADRIKMLAMNLNPKVKCQNL